MQKRGLSDVVTTVLIILLSIVAIGIIWVAINSFVGSGSEKIKIDDTTIEIVHSSVKLSNDLKSLSLVVQRKKGESSIKAVNIILEDESGQAKAFRQETGNFGALSSKKIDLVYSSSGLGNIKKISAVPIFTIENKGEEVSSRVGNYEVNKLEPSPYKVLQFDGQDDYANDSKTLGFPDSPDALTISLWAKQTSSVTDDLNYLISLYKGSASIYVDTQDKYKYKVSGTGVPPNSVGDIATLNDGKWHYFSYVLSFGSGFGNLKTYVDGVQRLPSNGFSYQASPPRVDTTFESIFIGKEDGPLGSYFPGQIDEIRIYDRALNVDEIGQIYISGRIPNSSLPSNGLFAWYKLDEELGNVAKDDASGVNDEMTLQKGAKFVNA